MATWQVPVGSPCGMHGTAAHSAQSERVTMQVSAARQAALAAWVRPSVFLAGRRPSAASGSLGCSAAHLRHHLLASSRQQRAVAVTAAAQQAAAAEQQAADAGQRAGPCEATQRAGKRKVALFIGYEGTEYRGKHPAWPPRACLHMLPRACSALHSACLACKQDTWPGLFPLLILKHMHTRMAGHPTSLMPLQACRCSPTRRCRWPLPQRPPWKTLWRRPSSELGASCRPTEAS